MSHKRRPSDVPDFLHNSPFLPYTSGHAESHEPDTVKKRPTIRDILRWKQLPVIIVFICGLGMLRYMWVKLNIPARFAETTCLTSEIVDAHNTLEPDKDGADIPWSDYAYAQYATDQDYLCNSVMIFEALHRFKSKASRFLMYPDSWSTDGPADSVESRLLNKARNDYNVELVPVEMNLREEDFSMSP